jgi:acetyl esterase/lipase
MAVGAGKLNSTKIALRANFGLPDWLTQTFLKRGGAGRRLMAWLELPAIPFLRAIFAIVRRLPWLFKHRVTLTAWRFWLAIHQQLPACIARRGISDSLSLEAHAIHNVFWWTRIFPAPVSFCRFGLSQLSVSYPPREARISWVDSCHTPGLRSAYLRLCPPSETQPKVLFWAFGGAYISGDVEGNIGLAEHYGLMLGCDAFVVDMRLCPEYCVQDAVLDLYRGYQWLLQQVLPENVIMLGISSGGGSCVRALQLAAGDEEARQKYFGGRHPVPPALPQPAGAILLGPFVDYTKVTESMETNTAFDLVVSPSILEVVLPLKNALAGSEQNLELCSPLYQSMTGLCPLLISVSDHECLIDEDVALAAKAKKDHVDVVLSTRPFMCHVYQLLSRFVPEAADEEVRIVEWVKARGGVWA